MNRLENTLASFAAALEVGVSAVELDTQLTRDGHVIVTHDSNLKRPRAAAATSGR